MGKNASKRKKAYIIIVVVPEQVHCRLLPDVDDYLRMRPPNLM
jgi:hypothetical protein